jgi:hypothetical protein
LKSSAFLLTYLVSNRILCERDKIEKSLSWSVGVDFVDF